MGCTSSTEKPAAVAPPIPPNIENLQPPVASKPVSEAASGHLGKPLSPDPLTNTQTWNSNYVMADAVVSFTASESGRPNKKSTAPAQKKSFDADLAEVDRLLELPTHELEAQPLSLRLLDNAPPTPSLTSRAEGVSSEPSASSSSSAKPVCALPPIAGKPVSAVLALSTDSMLAHLMEEEEPVKLAARPLPPPPVVPGGPVKSGGWGNGDLAAAGTLMLGEEQPTYSSATAARPPGYPDHDNFDFSPSAVTNGDDLGMEDMEDVDALLAEEMIASGLNSDLASKLARFEAMNEEDD
ncbi:hypothetical protein CEUSTIGMA_g6345.t1 [Chlamydomonas eustigma]|uniref:Uncharacterized protein n=1 Tax=Chlamydomonas eustigma TaxID=1157962 RepID=A0A250X779_9CHLO|nr:hypothetical protein CEUSTIGMA_g6345.t1 [Chlamydomonas eustigma]|eukprot:GAX78906.1 hypothetical protein CEUSTIGMA_g6345.t1 [Chlamydomonas eustigma]